MPNATAWLIFDQNYWDKFGIFGITPGGDAPDYLHQASTLADLAKQIGVDADGLQKTVERLTPTPDGHATRSSSAARRSSTATSGRTTRGWARTRPTPGSPSPPPRHGSGSPPGSARWSTGSQAGAQEQPREASLPGCRTSRKDHPPRARQPALKRPGTRPQGSLLRPRGPRQRSARSAGHGPTPAAVRSTPTAAPSPASTRPATPAVPPPKASTEAPAGPSRSDWSSATSPDSTPPSTAHAATRKGSSAPPDTNQSPDHHA